MKDKGDRIFRRHKGTVAHHIDEATRRERKAAGKLRRGFVRDKGGDQGGRVTEDNWEDLLDEHGHSARRPRLTEIIKRLGEAQEAIDADETDATAFETAAIVMSVTGGRCRAFFGGEEIDCVVSPHIAMRGKTALAVGDRVRVAREAEAWRVESVLPRRTVLARPDPLHKHIQKLIAANIDVVVHVVSFRAPALKPRLIDRVLIAIQRGGAQPVVCINKIDLVPPEEREAEVAKLMHYGDLAVPVIPCSTTTGEGLEALRAAVDGRTSALVGHSGVGKSSILNALDGRLALATGGLKRAGTGRHTTSRSTLYDFGGGTYLIDTPGIREFGLWDLDREALRDYFPEFHEPAEYCRFTNCTHVHEPDCEVKSRLADGKLNQARYEAYVRIWESLGH